MDGGAGSDVGHAGEEVGVGEDSGAVALRGHVALKFRALEVNAIDFSKAWIEPKMVGEQQFAVVGAITPDNFIEEEFERGAQVRLQRFVEIREEIGVFGCGFGAFGFEPDFEELIHLGSGARVVDHASYFAFEIVWRLEFAFGGSLPEGGVRDGIPEGEREARGGGKGIVLAEVRGVGVEEAGGFEGVEDDSFDGESGVGGLSESGIEDAGLLFLV